ncbi:MAG: radical SAM family heme chaperone HemW [Micropepsaceae bacterium]
MTEGAQPPGFALYVHWPFCLSKCPYCDFNSHVRAKIDAAAFGAALVHELSTVASRLDRKQPLNSIFFGGGTPSLMPGAIVADVIGRAEKLFGFAPTVEITLEANPTSADASRFREYRAAGVNRVSLGVQALNDVDLKALGRLHTVEEALGAVVMAQSIFERVSFDLIYARPHQNVDAWSKELDRALSFGCQHYSLYQLTFEEGTPFHAALQRGSMNELDVDTASALFELTQSRMESAGMPAYEVSNHACPGQESRHNLVYWRYGDYVGIGPGAHGRLTSGGMRFGTETDRQPERWLGQVESRGENSIKWVAIERDQQQTEAVLMGLRLSEGIDLKRMDALGTTPISRARISALQGQGYLSLIQGRLAATAKGRLVLNAVLKELLS